MLLVLLLQGLLSLPWDKMIYGAQGVLVLGMILAFFLKVIPAWERTKTHEFSLREKEVTVRDAEAQALKAMSENLYAVAVEQRRASDSTKVLQHSNSRDIDNYLEQLNEFGEQLAELKKQAEQKVAA